MGIICGMSHMHRHRIMHRDLKANNILIDSDYLPIICDFGTACFFDEVHTGLRTIGTIHWTAPEILAGQAYTEKVDVYSFGILLYELLTGLTPFREIPPIQIARLVKDKGHRPEIPDNCPDRLAGLIRDCWAQDPGQRPAFSELLPRFLSHEVAFAHTDFDELDQVAGFIRGEARPTVDYRPPVLDTEPSCLVPQESVIRELLDMAKSVRSQNCDDFFNAIVTAFKSRAPGEILSHLLSAILKVVRIPGACVLFNRTIIPENLPLEDHPRRVLWILQEMVEEDPNSLSSALTRRVLGIFRKCPGYVISFVRVYAERFDRADQPYPLLDGLLKRWRRSGDEESAFVGLLQYLCTTYDSYCEAREQYCGMIVNKILLGAGDAETVNTCYAFLCQFPDSFRGFDFDLLSRHLRHSRTIVWALRFFSTIEPTNCSRKVSLRLLFAAETHKKAIDALCRFMRLAKCRKFLLADLSFLQKKLPTYRKTFELFEALAEFPEVHIHLISSEFVPILLSNYLDECGESSLDRLSTQLLQLSDISLEFLDRLDRSGFCTTYFHDSLNCGVPSLTRSCLQVFRRFANIGFLNCFPSLLPGVFELIENRDPNLKSAISLLGLFSDFPECHAAIRHFKPRTSSLPPELSPRISEILEKVNFARTGPAARNGTKPLQNLAHTHGVRKHTKFEMIDDELDVTGEVGSRDHNFEKERVRIRNGERLSKDEAENHRKGRKS
jgi:hypothetical protein